MKPIKQMDIMEVIRRFFPQEFAGDSWKPWLAFFPALYGMELDDYAYAMFQQCTSRTERPKGAYREAWVIAGRRAGKSRVAAFTAVFMAVFRDYRGVTARGETPIVMLLAADKSQAQVIFKYILGFFEHRLLRPLIKRQTSEVLELTNGVSIEVHAASYRGVRGRTVVCCICDEMAYWRSDESTNPDVEVLNALRPSMITIPGALLLVVGSPYARRGSLYDAYQKHFGRDDSRVLVWQAPSLVMNQSLDPQEVARAYEDDPQAAAAEWDAQFRSDVEQFLTAEALDRVVIPSRSDLPPAQEFRYYAFVDPSGGSADSMTMCIAHAEGQGARFKPITNIFDSNFQPDPVLRQIDEDRQKKPFRIIVDLIKEVKPPFSPEQVVADFTDILRGYNLSRVTGDSYGGGWIAEAFRKVGVRYAPAEQNKTQIYRDFLPLINSGRVELPDDQRLLRQLLSLERKQTRTGRELVDHAPNAHDDVANAVAGACVLVGEPKSELHAVKLVGY
jgi:hypothetical protein